MRLIKVLPLLVCLWTAGAALAQAPAATTKPAGAILDQIPAGAMGFVVVQDVRTTTAAVDKFMAQIGQDKFFASEKAKDCLDFIRAQAMLGEGLDPKGGFAVVMLDLQQYGLTVLSLMSGRDDKGQPIQLPLVLMVPGWSIDSVFTQYERATPEGAKYVQVKLRMGPMFATASNGYVLLSPRQDALTAVLAAKQKAAADLSAADLKTIRSSAASAYVNMKVAGSMIVQFMKSMEDMQAAAQKLMGAKGGGQEMQTAEFKRMISETESILVSAHFTDLGPQLTVRGAFVKDSEMGKSLSSMGQIQASMLARLPNLDSIFALEFAGVAMTPERTQILTEQIEKSLTRKPLADLPEASRAKFKKFAMDWYDQVQGAQMVFGAAPKGKGLMGVAMVLQCKDSAKTKELISQGADVIAEIVVKQVETMKPHEGAVAPAEDATAPAPLAPPVADPKEPVAENPPPTEPAQPPLKITYKKNVAKVGATDVDAFVVSVPGLAEQQKNLVKFFGDEQVRMLMAAPNDKTVVVTFGGAEEMMATAIKAATEKSGTILGKDAQTVIDQLPKQRSMLAVFDLSNLFKMIKQIDPEDKTIPQTESHAPAAMSVGAVDSTIECVIIMPHAMIKDIIKAVKEAQGPAVPEEGETETPTTKPAKPPEEF